MHTDSSHVHYGLPALSFPLLLPSNRPCSCTQRTAVHHAQVPEPEREAKHFCAPKKTLLCGQLLPTLTVMKLHGYYCTTHTQCCSFSVLYCICNTVLHLQHCSAVGLLYCSVRCQLGLHAAPITHRNACTPTTLGDAFVALPPH